MKVVRPLRVIEEADCGRLVHGASEYPGFARRLRLGPAGGTRGYRQNQSYKPENEISSHYRKC